VDEAVLYTMLLSWKPGLDRQQMDEALAGCG